MGFNIVLLARDSHKMNTIESDLLKISKNIKIKKIEANFTHLTKYTDYTNIKNEIDNIDISILINNAGIGYLN